jgi:hypothetical protein
VKGLAGQDCGVIRRKFRSEIDTLTAVRLKYLQNEETIPHQEVRGESGFFDLKLSGRKTGSDDGGRCRRRMVDESWPDRVRSTPRSPALL